MDAEYIRDVIGRINKLDSKEKTHILSILKATNNTFTKNANGYFFNLAVVPEEIINKIVKCVELIEKNRDLIKDMDKRRESLLIYYKGIIEETLMSSMRNKRENYLNMLRIVEHTHNMKLVINRKQTIKWRNNYSSDVDPDELIKEYNKSRHVYEKKSVYGRILAKMKAMRSGKSRGNDAGGDSDTFGSGRDMTDYQDGEGGGDGEYFQGEDYQDGERNVTENDQQSDYDKDSDKESEESEPQHPDEYDNTAQDNEDDNQSTLDEDDNQSTNDERTKSNKRSSKTTKASNPSKTKTDTEQTNTHEQEMSFYKRLLNQQGFKFREKAIVLTYQEYIK